MIQHSVHAASAEHDLGTVACGRVSGIQLIAAACWNNSCGTTLCSQHHSTNLCRRGGRYNENRRSVAPFARYVRTLDRLDVQFADYVFEFFTIDSQLGVFSWERGRLARKFR